MTDLLDKPGPAAAASRPSIGGGVVLRLGGVASMRFHGRLVVVTVLLFAVALAAAVVALGLGEARVSAVDVVRTIFADTGHALETLVIEWRMPRVLICLVFGVALGLGGAIFQSLTHNPLGSPDILGFDSGAFTGAIVTILAVGSTAYVIPGAIGGGVATALTVYLLAYQRGVQGFRLIVVGIAVTSVLGALNVYLMAKAELQLALMAAVWSAGSVNGVDWADTERALITIGLLLLPLLWWGRRLKILEMGDDAARALGVHVESTRLILIVCGTALTATVTALAGPILFVSLAAPQLARRLTRAPGVQLWPSAAMGACLFIVCDQVGLHAFSRLLPVGLITIVLGGAYLIWLLVLGARKEIS